MAGKRNLFRITRFILLKFPGLFRLFAKFRPSQKRLLIIKADAIGDYILFRNFLEVVRKSGRFKDYRITLLGNKLWQDLALTYDAGFVDEFVFIDAESLYHSPIKTLQLGWRLFRNNFAVVLQPSSTRRFITDGLAALTAAKQIIGFESDNEAMPERYKIKTDKFYTARLSLLPNASFEFDRNKFFFENVLDTTITLNGPTIPVNHSGKGGVVIFPGAGISKRSWEKEKFLGLIKLLSQNTSQVIYLAGGESELQIGDYLTGNLPPNFINNLIGKTSLPQLVDLIGNVALVITNETSAAHIAAATQTKSVCILGGGHFERFAPYPEHIPNRLRCVFEKIECYYCNWNCKFQTKENEPFPCISIISLQSVWEVVQQLLPTEMAIKNYPNE